MRQIFADSLDLSSDLNVLLFALSLSHHLPCLLFRSFSELVFQPCLLLLLLQPDASWTLTERTCSTLDVALRSFLRPCVRPDLSDLPLASSSVSSPDLGHLHLVSLLLLQSRNHQSLELLHRASSIIVGSGHWLLDVLDKSSGSGPWLACTSSDACLLACFVRLVGNWFRTCQNFLFKLDQTCLFLQP